MDNGENLSTLGDQRDRLCFDEVEEVEKKKFDDRNETNRLK